MTEEQIFGEIMQCCEGQETLEELLARFEDITHDSPLTSSEENVLIEWYELRVSEIKEFYKTLVDSYVKLYQDMQST